MEALTVPYGSVIGDEAGDVLSADEDAVEHVILGV